MIEHEQAEAEGVPAQQGLPGEALDRVGDQQHPEQQFLHQGRHQQQLRQPRQGLRQGRPLHGHAEEAAGHTKGQRQSPIARQHEQAAAQIAGLKGGQQAGQDPVEQGAQHRQVAQQGGWIHRQQLGGSGGDLVGADQPDRQTGAQDVRGHGVVGAAGQHRVPAEQHISQLLAALKAAAAAIQAAGGVVAPIGARTAEGGEPAVKGRGQPGQPLLVARHEIAEGLVLAQLLDGDPQGLAGILHTGGGRGDHRHPATIAAAVAGGQDLGLEGQGIEHPRLHRHQHIREGARAQPAALQVAGVGAPVLAAGHDAVGIVGVDLVVADRQPGLTAHGVAHHLGLAEGEVPRGGPEGAGLGLGAADPAEQMDQQGPLPHLPARRDHPIGHQGGGVQAAGLALGGAPVGHTQMVEAGGRAVPLALGREGRDPAGLQGLHGEHAITGRRPLDLPALLVERRVRQRGEVEGLPAEAVGGQAGKTDALLRPVETAACRIEMAHQHLVVLGRGLQELHQSLPAAGDLHGRTADDQAAFLDVHALQCHGDVVHRPGPRQRLQGAHPVAAIESARHHVVGGLQLAGVRPEADVHGHGLDDPPQVRAIRPAQTPAAADQGLLVRRCLLQLDPYPVARGGGGLGSAGQDQPPEPLGAGGVAVRGRLQGEGIGLWPIPG